MRPFQYICVTDKAPALEAGTLPGARFIGGGTNLLDLMKLDVEQPHRVVDINRLPLSEIEFLELGTVRIGALVRNSDLAYHPKIKLLYPLLSQALLSGASPQLRNMATVGGNLMQRTRCPYFYDLASECNRRTPGIGCAALDGYNRSHALLGTSEQCIATHPSDMCVALAALGAVIHTCTATTVRQIPIADFHLLPGTTPDRETVLESGELITAVTIPELPFGFRSHYLKVRDRASYEFALASAAVALDVTGQKINAARVALGGIGTKPWRSIEAEKVLTGALADDATFKKAADAALVTAQPRRHNAFKVELAKNTLIQTLNIVAKMS